MYGIFTYIYPKNGTNVYIGKYSIHGASGTGRTRAMPLTPPKHRLFKVRGGGLGIGDELGIGSIWHPGGSWKPWGPQDSW